MSNALKGYAASQKTARTATPQGQRTPGRTDEVRNNAGGFVFKVSDKDRLERFLILGTDGGTYYVRESDLTKQNVTFLREMIKSSERQVVDTIVAVSDSGRAAKNGPALFALALVLTEGTDKAYAKAAVSKVARTSTHLFEFASYVDALGGWGRAKRSAIANWYESQDAGRLAYQAVKYRGGRNGWTHRDLFRKSHPAGVDRHVGNFILGKNNDSMTVDARILDGFAAMQAAKSVKDVVRVLNEYTNLPWETIPTQFLKDAKVWETLFYNGALGQTALLRNVTRFARIGAFDNMVFAKDVADALADAERIRKGRVHPVAYANALGIYRDGQIDGTSGWYATRNKNWDTNPKVLAAIEAGFYNAFETVEPANKRTMVSIDVSGSMTWGAPAGLVGLDYMGAAAAMAMVLVRTEPYVTINAFSTDMRALDISESDSLESVDRKIRNARGGGTDCALPMVHAKSKGLNIDTFTVWTDNETWAGRIKPSQALVEYRKARNPEARLAVVAMAASPFTIADPNDKGMMDFVGFDAGAPRVLADFSAGRI